MNEKILTIEEDEEKLRYRADEINDVRQHGKLVQDLSMRIKKAIKYNNLTGLTATQIGVPYRFFSINFSGQIRNFINPMVVNCKNMMLSRETCSSIPGKEFLVPRYSSCELQFQNEMGELKSVTLLGAAACKLQHCVDHLEGVLISDFALEIPEEYDEASDEEKQELVSYYLDSINMRLEELNKEIDEDENLSKMNDAVKFIQSVQSGETQIELVEETPNE